MLISHDCGRTLESGTIRDQQSSTTDWTSLDSTILDRAKAGLPGSYTGGPAVSSSDSGGSAVIDFSRVEGSPAVDYALQFQAECQELREREPSKEYRWGGRLFKQPHTFMLGKFHCEFLKLVMR